MNTPLMAGGFALGKKSAKGPVGVTRRGPLQVQHGKIY